MKIFIFLFFSIVASFASGQTLSVPAWKGGTDIECSSGAFQCLNEADFKSSGLIGKTLKYKHPRNVNVGITSVTVKDQNQFVAKNNSGEVSGSWKMDGVQFLFKPEKNWQDFTLTFVRASDHLFVIFTNRETGVYFFHPVEVVNN